MSKKKKILLMLAKGGVSQSEVAAALHASKRDVSACARAIREHGIAFDDVSAMTEAEVDGMLAPSARGKAESAYLVPDMAPLVERKKRNRKLTVKMFWMEHCEEAASAGKSAYSYQTFCEMFADAAERAGAPTASGLRASPTCVSARGRRARPARSRTSAGSRGCSCRTTPPRRRTAPRST